VEVADGDDALRRCGRCHRGAYYAAQRNERQRRASHGPLKPPRCSASTHGGTLALASPISNGVKVRPGTPAPRGWFCGSAATSVSKLLPRISVILPAFNRAELVRDAIDSVLAQDFRDFELIVVDDGSTDGTADAVRAYPDPRIRLLTTAKNRGSNAARNAGIRHAQALLLAFLDSDDRYLPNKLSHVVHAFESQPELEVLVDSFIKLTSPKAKRPQLELRNPVTNSTAEFASKLFRHELWKATSAISVKREAAIRAGVFAEHIKQRQDLDFLIRLTECAACRSTDEILWVKTWAADRITSRRRFVTSTIELVRRHPQFLGVRDYRVGLARDLTRHMMLLLRDRQFAQIAEDIPICAHEFGVWRTSALIGSGTRELLARAVKRRLRRRRVTGSSAVAAPAPARSRVSARS
jgi:glycosyltransferase involved in cell wall biosynthesis